VIKSYPLFCEDGESVIEWSNLPSSSCKDVKKLRLALYVKREEEIVLIAQTKLVTCLDDITPPLRQGMKTVVLKKYALECESKWTNWNGRSSVQCTYSFVPKQFAVEPIVLCRTRLPQYPCEIPVIIQMIKLHILQDTQALEAMIQSNSKEISETEKTKVDELTGSLNSGHYKFTGIEITTVFFVLLRWFMSLPKPVLDSSLANSSENDSNSNQDSFIINAFQTMREPQRSLLLWVLDFCIEMCQWFPHPNDETLERIVDTFEDSLFGIRKKNNQPKKSNQLSFLKKAAILRKNQFIKI